MLKIPLKTRLLGNICQGLFINGTFCHKLNFILPLLLPLSFKRVPFLELYHSFPHFEADF